MCVCVAEVPSPVAEATMKMVTKVVQNLANLVEFKVKEPHMMGLNHFVKDNMEKMRHFVDSASVRRHVVCVQCCTLVGFAVEHFVKYPFTVVGVVRYFI